MVDTFSFNGNMLQLFEYLYFCKTLKTNPT